MKIAFRNNELENLANGIWDHKYPVWIWIKYRAILYELRKMDTIKEIREYHGWMAEWKEWKMSDMLWIRINKSWRLLCKIEKWELQVLLIRDINNHYQ